MTIVHRTKKLQEEKNLVTKVKFLYSVRWDGCKYYLKLISTNSRSMRKFKNEVHTVEIVNINADSSYDYSCPCGEKTDRKPNDTMYPLTKKQFWDYY